MDYETLELKATGTFFGESDEDAEEAALPVSSTYACVEGADSSPYIITSTLHG